MSLTRRDFLLGGSALAALGIAAYALRMPMGTSTRAAEGTFEVAMSEDQWKAKLGEDAFQVLRHEATERPFSSPLNDEHRAGTFSCAGCDLTLFDSATKFDSGTGWPSFYQPISATAVGETVDSTLGMTRTEVHCSRCGGHLGHVFDDGPQPTGLRYCMNGLSLTFAPKAA
jgi:peptide-methionine (R)-S-oxide reductase